MLCLISTDRECRCFTMLKAGADCHLIPVTENTVDKGKFAQVSEHSYLDISTALCSSCAISEEGLSRGDVQLSASPFTGDMTDGRAEVTPPVG